MKTIPSYPIWLSAFMLLGPFLMVGGAGLLSKELIWLCEIVGALMVMVALFYLSKRLHEQTEEVASLRKRLNTKDEANQSSSTWVTSNRRLQRSPRLIPKQLQPDGPTEKLMNPTLKMIIIAVIVATITSVAVTLIVSLAFGRVNGAIPGGVAGATAAAVYVLSMKKRENEGK
jgi:Flp pilus assembly protein TadB